jgi:hypothetical protein
LTYSVTEITSYPVSIIEILDGFNQRKRTLRESSVRIWTESASCKEASESFIYDAAKLWNIVPKEIKISTSLTMARKSIKRYSKILPI